jgi:signal transduction histidine kinase
VTVVTDKHTRFRSGAMASRFPFSLAVRHSPTPLDVYLWLVFTAGVAVVALLLPSAITDLQDTTPVFWVLAACALPAEIIRFEVVDFKGEGRNQVTLSRPYVLAMLILWGAPLTVVVFVVAGVTSDLIVRRPAIRVAFNAGQYALCIAAAGAIYTALGGQHSSSFTLTRALAVLAAMITLAVVNRGLVRVAVALHEHQPLTLGYLLLSFTAGLTDLLEIAVQLSVVLVALLVAQRSLLPLLLALPAVPLYVAGRTTQRVVALRMRRHGRADEFADLERRREAVLRMVELQLAGLAADLHDGPVQEFQRLATQIHMAKASITAGNPEAAGLLQQLEERVRAETRSLRRVVTELRPPVLSRLGLAGALTHLGKEFEATSGIVCTVQAGAVEGLPEELEVVLYRVTQEALANVGQHAHASHVQVTMASSNGAVQLQIHDDGTGFDPDLVR